MRKLLAFYIKRLAERRISPVSVYWSNQEGDVPQLPAAAESHVMWMLQNMPDQQDSPIKFHRWVGFIQGVLWLKGHYSLNELRAQVKEAKALDAGRAVKRAERVLG